MAQVSARRPLPAVRRVPDGELLCLLCGSVVAETYGNRVVHRSECKSPLTWRNGRPRCCKCGGALICEPVFDNWGSPWIGAADVDETSRGPAGA